MENQKFIVEFVVRKHDPDESQIVRLTADVRTAVNLMALLPAIENVCSIALIRL